MIWVLIAFSFILGIVAHIEEATADSRTKIGIIDSGISHKQSNSAILCKNGRKSAIKKDLGYDEHGHGTNIFGLVAQDLDSSKYCIISYKVWTPNVSGSQTIAYTISSVKQAITDGVRFLNISMNGDYPDATEFSVFQEAVNHMVVIVAAGNEKSDLDKNCNAFPACYSQSIDKNFYVIGGYDVEQSNYGKNVDFYTYGNEIGSPVLTGTSQATAYFTNKFVQKKFQNVVYSSRRF